MNLQKNYQSINLIRFILPTTWFLNPLKYINRYYFLIFGAAAAALYCIDRPFTECLCSRYSDKFFSSPALFSTLGHTLGGDRGRNVELLACQSINMISASFVRRYANRITRHEPPSIELSTARCGHSDRTCLILKLEQQMLWYGIWHFIELPLATIGSLSFVLLL